MAKKSIVRPGSRKYWLSLTKRVVERRGIYLELH
jgi:hypothetical protein